MPLTISIIAIIISALALVFTGITAYFTFFHRGTIVMTRPNQFYFGPDRPTSSSDRRSLPKITFRSLLCSTSKRGRIIENLYISFKLNSEKWNFSIWTYGNEKPSLAGGLFVPESGVEAYHHFLRPEDGRDFGFAAGVYNLEVHAHILGGKRKVLLFSHPIEITPDIAEQLLTPLTGVYFDWAVEKEEYVPHVQAIRMEPVQPRF